MYSATWLNNVHRSDILPPLTVKKSVKESDQWQKAVMDSFEHIALTQFRENLDFVDYYRMVDGKLSFQEMSEVIPQLDNIEDLLDGVGVPTFIKHYDLLGTIIRALVGKYIDLQDKFHVTDVGEVAENELLRFKNEEAQKMLTGIIDNYVSMHLAENGINPTGQEFQSEEERMQFMQQLEAQKEELIPDDLDRDIKKSFKTIGMRWGEATLEKDKELFSLSNMEKEELKHYLISGRCFRHYRINHDSYEPEIWSPQNTFFSKEVEAKYPQRGEYVGRIHWMTPAEVIKKWGHLMDSKLQKEVLGGNPTWKTFVGDGVHSGTIEQAIGSNFVKPQRTPFSNYYDYNFALGIQDDLGIPMGEHTEFKSDGTQETRDSFIPRMHGDSYGRYNIYAEVLRDDFNQRRDYCQVTEAYFRAYDLYGYLTYENEYGRVVTEEVTEDILKDFIKENDIKQTFKESLHDIVDSFEVNTIKWFYRPVCYEGVKIQSQHTAKPIYLYCKPCDHQIKGDSEFDILLPVGGVISKSLAKKIDPFQAQYNLCMNQMRSLIEKELGMFFLMDVNLIPSEFEGFGNAEDALMALRNVAKEVGIMPVATSGDSQRNNNTFNQFSTYDISYTPQINNRVQLAEFYQRKAYETIGINPQMFMEPTKYESAEGVRQSAEAHFAQVSEIFEDFNDSNRNTLELHLSVAQYAQSNKKDLSLMYTKSDASIEFLKLQDPDFPLRRLGLIPSADRRKRKELEEFKAYLMNTNTLGSDTLEVAKLIGSDAMSEIIEIARIERENREEMKEEEHQRALELQERQANIKDQQDMDKFEREEMSKERDRQVRIKMETIEALGRAASKDSSEESFDEIYKARDNEIKEKSLNHKIDKDLKDMKNNEKNKSKEFDLKMKELELKAEQLRQRAKETKAKIYTSEINKN